MGIDTTERFAVSKLQLLDFRHDHRAELVLFKSLGITVGHEGPLSFFSDLVTVGPHDVGQRRLALPETGQMGVPSEVLRHSIKLGVDSLDVELDAELFFARGQVCNGYFHRNILLKVGGFSHR